MAGGGLALMVVPPLTDATSWRAPYWSAAALALLAAVPDARSAGPSANRSRRRWLLRDRRLLPLGILQAATFGLAVVAGNWAVPLLERQGVGSAAAGLAAGLILFAGIVTRPVGGVLAGRRVRSRARRQRPRRRRARCSSCSQLGGPLALSTLGALVLGLMAGLSFAVIFAAAQRARPDAPGAAIALVNACGVLTILVGTPLAGLAFEARRRRATRVRRASPCSPRPRCSRSAPRACSAIIAAFRASEGDFRDGSELRRHRPSRPPVEPARRALLARGGDTASSTAGRTTRTCSGRSRSRCSRWPSRRRRR